LDDLYTYLPNGLRATSGSVRGAEREVDKKTLRPAIVLHPAISPAETHFFPGPALDA
jgi:hypothetical protein